MTERILELADQEGYVFDEDVFDFVTVRDRIRCYYKSYVQSSKKRGTFVGFGANSYNDNDNNNGGNDGNPDNGNSDGGSGPNKEAQLACKEPIQTSNSE